jgi:hypothetical protein
VAEGGGLLTRQEPQYRPEIDDFRPVLTYKPGCRWVPTYRDRTPSGHSLGHSFLTPMCALRAHVVPKMIVASRKATEHDLGEESDDHED